MDYTSKYITVDDEVLKNISIPPNSNWWSKAREYKFASKFLKKNDIILDAGCGIEHPFKNYASEKVKRVVAVDKDERIKELRDTNNITFDQIDLCFDNYNLFDATFDKIFCLSVFEQIKPPSQIINILNMFKRILKDDGFIIITINHPFLVSDHFVNYVNESKLIFSSEANYKIPKNVLNGPYNGLKCYTAVLEKNKNRRKKIKPESIKTEFPNETK